MSWFKKRPIIKEAPNRRPHHTSPAADKMMDKAKEAGPQKNLPKPTRDK